MSACLLGSSVKVLRVKLLLHRSCFSLEVKNLLISGVKVKMLIHFALYQPFVLVAMHVCKRPMLKFSDLSYDVPLHRSVFFLIEVTNLLVIEILINCAFY